jgi:hypothetical protein
VRTHIKGTHIGEMFTITMNLTSLIFHALATERALETGYSYDPSIMKLTDDIFKISGADECAFGACTGNLRNLFFDPAVGDYITNEWVVPESYNWIEYGDLFDGGRTFTLQFNNSLPAFKTVVAACARAALPTVLELEGDGMDCFNGKNKFNVQRETVDDMLLFYHRTLDYNTCLKLPSAATSEMSCLVSTFGLNANQLQNAARASRQVKVMLTRRLAFLTSDILDVRDIANRYINDRPTNNGSGALID